MSIQSHGRTSSPPTALLSVRPKPRYATAKHGGTLKSLIAHSSAVLSTVDQATKSQSISTEEKQLGQYIPLHYHYNMLQDAQRVGAFKQAIESTVRPGMHVVELGGGTGILSSFAARCGAKVTCVERNPELVECARHLIKANGLGKQISVISADARNFIPDEPVDAVICEMLHVGLLREKQLQVIEAFKQNYSKHIGGPSPRFLPEASLLTFQAISHPFDFSGYCAPVPLFQSPDMQSLSTLQLSDLKRYATVLYDQPYSNQLSWNEEVSIEQTGRLNALRFITLNLIAITEATGVTCEWPNQFLVLPVKKPFEVAQGDRVRVQFEYHAGDSLNSLADSIRLEKTA